MHERLQAYVYSLERTGGGSWVEGREGGGPLRIGCGADVFMHGRLQACILQLGVYWKVGSLICMGIPPFEAGHCLTGDVL